MSYKFIYVFDEDGKNALLLQGYTLLKTDKAQGVYVFINREDMKFDLGDSGYVMSNTVTF